MSIEDMEYVYTPICVGFKLVMAVRI